MKWDALPLSNVSGLVSEKCNKWLKSMAWQYFVNLFGHDNPFDDLMFEDVREEVSLGYVGSEFRIVTNTTHQSDYAKHKIFFDPKKWQDLKEYFPYLNTEGELFNLDEPWDGNSRGWLPYTDNWIYFRINSTGSRVFDNENDFHNIKRYMHKDTTVFYHKNSALFFNSTNEFVFIEYKFIDDHFKDDEHFFEIISKESYMDIINYCENHPSAHY